MWACAIFLKCKQIIHELSPFVVCDQVSAIHSWWIHIVGVVQFHGNVKCRANVL
jgi:hypothetical protein